MNKSSFHRRALKSKVLTSAFALILALGSLSFFGISPAFAVTSLSCTSGTANHAYFTASEDAQTNQASKTINYGSSTTMGVNDNSAGMTDELQSYVKFTVSGVDTSKVVDVHLCAYGNGPSGGPKIVMYRSGVTWSESTVNWNNRPNATATGSQCTPNMYPVPSGAYAGFNAWRYGVNYFDCFYGLSDVNGTWSFGIIGGTGTVSFSTRESSNPPYLDFTLNP